MNRRRVRFLLLGCDLTWIVIALSLAILSRFVQGRLQSEELRNFVPTFLASIAIWPILFAWLRLDGFRWGVGITAITANVLVAVVSMFLVISTTQFALRRPVPRGTVAIFGLLLVVGFITIRRGVLAFLRRGHRLGESQRVLIVGSGVLSREVQEKIDRHPEFLYEIAGYLHSDLDVALDNEHQTADIVRSGGLKRLLQEQQINEVFVVERRLPTGEMSRLFEICTELGIGLSFVPQTYEMYVFRPEMMDLGGLPFIRLQPVSLSYAASVSKRCMDLVLSSAFILLLAPVMALIALYARVTTGRVFSLEARIGAGCKPFTMLRFNVDANDFTRRFDRFCNRLSLTDLPQVINVFRGEMSWVGPRPESPERVKHYSDWQRLRLRVAPGITGFAQVHGLRTTHSTDAKVKFDLQYIQSWSPLLDISLLLQTVSTIVARGSRLERAPGSANRLSEVNRPC
jgi:lipopolysaccharide/colanic/teichoic acid biosynthesis glycosyltransferase